MSDPVTRSLDNREIITVADIDLVAALTALGVPCCPDTPFVKVRTPAGEDVTHFNLEPTSRCGKYETRALIRCWTDQKFADESLEHPFLYAKCALANRKRLVDAAKSARAFVPVRKVAGNGKTYTYLVRDGGPAHTALTAK